MQQNAMLSPTKRSAISYKTQCNLLQNAMLSRAKRNAKWCKTHSQMLHFVNFNQTYAHKNDRNNTLFQVKMTTESGFSAT